MSYDKESISKALQFFSSLADETRLKILLSLLDGPRNVGGIYEFVGKDKMTLSAISHQLSQLHALNIVDFEKQGQEKLYRLSDNFCWCILKDLFKQFKGHRCPNCSKVGK